MVGFSRRVVAFVLGCAPLAAGAVTLHPLPGSTSQTTCNLCFFPNPIGVIARDEAGAPMAGVPVTFSIPGADGVMPADIPSREFKVMTGADGVASPRFIAIDKDKATITASTPGAAAIAFNLKIKDKGPTRFERVSGDGQAASLWTDFAQPWKVRALDRHGRPVPLAAVLFAVPDTTEFAGGLFGPKGEAVVAADANGIATSPALTANGVLGSGSGGAFGFGFDAPFVPFHFENIGPPAPRITTLVQAQWPDNQIDVPVAPHTVRVTDAASGAPVANVPVVFQVDPVCGYWEGGSAAFTVATDAEGFAQSPFLVGISATTSCAVSGKASGASPMRFPRHLYWLENVVFSIDPPAVDALVFRNFDIVITMTESGLPVEEAVLFPDISQPGGPTARLVRQIHDPLTSPGTVRYTFQANGFTGTYFINFIRDPIFIPVQVTQRR